MENKELIELAKSIVKPRELSDMASCGVVSAVLVSEKGNIYKGLNIDVPCSMGFCAEHAAIASMITAGESRIAKIVAVQYGGKILPPCGRCREFMYQINHENINTEVILEDGVHTLGEILPYLWKK